MKNLFKQIGFFLLGLTILITCPVWIPLALLCGLCFGITHMGSQIWWEFRN